MNLRRLLSQAALLSGAVLLSAGIQTFAAFSQPSTSPPNADAYPPLTTSGTAESKGAGLTLNVLGADVGLIVNGKVGIGTAIPAGSLDVNGDLCIKGDCISNWEEERQYPIYKETIIPIIPAVNLNALPDIAAGRNGQWNCVTVYNNTSLGGFTLTNPATITLNIHASTGGAPRAGNQIVFNAYLNGTQVTSFGSWSGGNGYWPYNTTRDIALAANTPYNSFKIDECTLRGASSMQEGGHPSYLRIDAINAHHLDGYDFE